MADVLAVRNEYQAQNWAMVIQEGNNRVLSRREFCLKPSHWDNSPICSEKPIASALR